MAPYRHLRVNKIIIIGISPKEAIVVNEKLTEAASRENVMASTHLIMLWRRKQL